MRPPSLPSRLRDGQNALLNVRSLLTHSRPAMGGSRPSAPRRRHTCVAHRASASRHQRGPAHRAHRGSASKRASTSRSTANGRPPTKITGSRRSAMPDGTHTRAPQTSPRSYPADTCPGAVPVVETREVMFASHRWVIRDLCPGCVAVPPCPSRPAWSHTVSLRPVSTASGTRGVGPIDGLDGFGCSRAAGLQSGRSDRSRAGRPTIGTCICAAQGEFSAEAVGFEPTRRLATPTSFQVRRRGWRGVAPNPESWR